MLQLKSLLSSLLVAFFLLTGCKPMDSTRLQGYVEGEPLLLAARQDGQLISLNAGLGDIVATGQVLFTQNLSVTTVSANQAESVSTPAYPAGLPDEHAATRTRIAASEAAHLRSESISLLHQQSPVAGRIQSIYHRAGDRVTSGQPVISILPTTSIKIRFFVQEKQLAALRRGQEVKIYCDGCASPFEATIRHINQSAEYMASSQYPISNRQNQRYMVEAWPRPADALQLHPGQPVDISLGM